MRSVRLSLWCRMGHYRIPGEVSTLLTQGTYPYPTPATIRGAIESLAGFPRDTLWNHKAYRGHKFVGNTSTPRGRDLALLQDFEFAYAVDQSTEDREHHPECLEASHLKGSTLQRMEILKGTRPVKRVVFLNPRFQLAIRGSDKLLDRVEQNLKGAAGRSGLWSIGTSDGVVVRAEILPRDHPSEARWVVSGEGISSLGVSTPTTMPLWVSEVAHKERRIPHCEVSLTDPISEIPQEAWFK